MFAAHIDNKLQLMYNHREDEKSRMWLPLTYVIYHENGGGVYDRNRIITNNKITIFCSYRSNYYSICLSYSIGYNLKQIK